MSVDEDVEKCAPLFTAEMERKMLQPPYKLSGRSSSTKLPYNTAASTLGMNQRELKMCVYPHAWVFITLKWRQLKCPPAYDWVRRRWFRHTEEYYSAMNRSDILVQAATWVNLGSMLRSERRWSQKATDWAIPFI